MKLKDVVDSASGEFRDYVLADSFKVTKYKSAVDRILNTLGISPPYFISDESMFADFMLEGAEYSLISKKLGIEISKTDYIVDIAEQLTKKELDSR